MCYCDCYCLYRRNKETSLQVRLQSTTARYISDLMMLQQNEAWRRLGQLGVAWVHLGYSKYNGICGA